MIEIGPNLSATLMVCGVLVALVALFWSERR